MTNFDFLDADSQFASFASIAKEAELVFSASTKACALMCRSAMEAAVKWVYSVDSALTMPYDDRLFALIESSDFNDILPSGMNGKLSFLRKLGNNASHTQNTISTAQATQGIKYLFDFLDFVAFNYAKKYETPIFNSGILKNVAKAAATKAEQDELVRQAKADEQLQINLNKLKRENASLREELSKRREDRSAIPFVTPKPDLTEKQTREAYIDNMLQDAGWIKGKNWVDEYLIDEMSNKAGVGKADYVLFGDDKLPLAVVEAKRTSNNLEEGRQQAKLYADYLEKKFGRRPIIFLTNGYETRIWNDQHYPERKVSFIYSRRDLEKEFNLMRDRKPLLGVQIDDNITNRYYQKEAIQAVCDSFSERNRRKALLVMATGSGKTRITISLADVLIRYGWVKNVLFLADRNALVTQAHRSFYNHMSDQLTLCNLVKDKENANARIVFSTYQTMMSVIDDARDEDGGKLYSVGHFDLIIVDEAHRSIYRKYQNIFNYFDAFLVGLTATPKAEIDKNTYSLFDLADKIPTYGYELDQAVTDGYLVNYSTIKTSLKFMEQGIVYDDLSAEDQAIYEETFTDEDSDTLPAFIDSNALNEWVFNRDTICKMFSTLMNKGLHIDYGTKIGKTIIFAKNHNHAERIVRIWGEEYPDYDSHYCQVIDNTINYVQTLIDDFGTASKMPQIAVSVDMLDTGIDVPEILNLVFFKKVMSRAKFWQMVGRGTRLCPGLIDGTDKDGFYIFDLCGNFDFFKANTKDKEPGIEQTLQEKMFVVKASIAMELQDLHNQTDELREFREELVKDLQGQVSALNRDAFDVRQHLRAVDKFVDLEGYALLSTDDIEQIKTHVAPLITPSTDDPFALRFDMLVYQIELAALRKQPYSRAKNDLLKKANALSRLGTLPIVMQQKELITQILNNSYLDRIDVLGFEDLRLRLRELITFIPYDERRLYETDFTDEILDITVEPGEGMGITLENYRRSVEWHLHQHEDDPIIAKIKNNQKVTLSEIHKLEQFFWRELGTKEQYEKNYGSLPIGELVRSVVGLSKQAANEAFSQFLNSVQLNSKQMHFVELVVEYIVKNGLMKDLKVLQRPPFNTQGSFAQLFDPNTFAGLREVIKQINDNARAA